MVGVDQLFQPHSIASYDPFQPNLSKEGILVPVFPKPYQEIPLPTVHYDGSHTALPIPVQPRKKLCPGFKLPENTDPGGVNVLSSIAHIYADNAVEDQLEKFRDPYAEYLEGPYYNPPKPQPCKPLMDTASKPHNGKSRLARDQSRKSEGSRKHSDCSKQSYRSKRPDRSKYSDRDLSRNCNHSRHSDRSKHADHSKH